MSQPTDTTGWTKDDWLMQRYHYLPSAPAAYVFAALFGISTVVHLIQLVKWKTWYFIPFFVGGLFEIGGYLMRAIDASQANKILFINQTSLILLAPALYAASIYMILKRIIIILDAESYALVSTRWLTRFFVGCDVLSFLIQGAGGAMQASKDPKPGRQDMAKYLVVGGLILQLVAFAFFIAVTATFHVKIHRRPTVKSITLQAPWKRYIYILYSASLLITVRSIFRVIEYMQGRDGHLMSHEAYAYVLDTSIMFLVSMQFNIFHPAKIVSSRAKDHVLLKTIDPDSDV